MVFSYDITPPKVKFYQTLVHRYGITRPVVPVTSHQVYTQTYHDTSSANLITTYIFLILFLSLCYRLIDKAFFQGRLINSIFNFDEEDLDPIFENESDDVDNSKSNDKDSYYFDDSEEKEKQDEQKEKVSKVTSQSENAEVNMSS
ncbi:hypothetical protein C922_02020 [Plasmodium inui San Antonio 1]|uniref:Uncharacterized protein n=1 Tax=Plasmodium inui San Antonio 1 TaxID=1237626 RepID=W7AQV6_9APIC|nr:hypothetical protein C922_02020 [Plasmodium inui San Antonio 1]EUD67831.1 hypothetical protein C922_02020 [Plasmodium inui San Antonio 1]